MRSQFAHRLLRLCLLGGLVAAAHPASAQIKQPDGTIIPVTDNFRKPLNGQSICFNCGVPASVRSQALPTTPVTYVNENITTVNNYSVAPEVFAPLCSFKLRYIYKGGGALFGIGWYNVNLPNGSPRTAPPVYRYDGTKDINTTAADSDINLLVPFTNANGTAITDDNLPLDVAVNNIIADPRYTRGLIGLALIPRPTITRTAACCPNGATSCLASCLNGCGCGTGNTGATQYHYTEAKYNIKCTLCSVNPGAAWNSFLIYKSTILENTFYLGFEDLDFADKAGSAGINGNDLDYDDFTFQFSGLTCSGAGQPCTVAANQGACQIGVNECDAKGAIYCKALVAPGKNPEICDGIDNDCNGSVDDGAKCGAGQVCDRGRCTNSCSSEFPCATGLSCSAGHCIDQACVGVTCSATQVCRAGVCASPCDGIKCPSPYICSGGNCIDPCTDGATGAPVVCKDPAGNPDPKKTCVNGACVTTCDCLPCSAASGLACQPSSGKCIDPLCISVSCGPGDNCVAGNCVDACLNTVCPSNQQCTSGKCVDIIDTTPGGGADLGSDPVNGGAVATGCGCRLSPAEGSAPLGALAAATLLLAFALHRRRRQSSQPN